MHRLIDLLRDLGEVLVDHFYEGRPQGSGVPIVGAAEARCEAGVQTAPRDAVKKPGRPAQKLQKSGFEPPRQTAPSRQAGRGNQHQAVDEIGPVRRQPQGDPAAEGVADNDAFSRRQGLEFSGQRFRIVAGRGAVAEPLRSAEPRKIEEEMRKAIDRNRPKRVGAVTLR